MGPERATNPFFQTTEVMQFLARALNQQRYPAYYRDMAAINVAGPKLLGLDPAPPARKLTADAVQILDAQREPHVGRRCASGANYDKGIFRVAIASASTGRSARGSAG